MIGAASSYPPLAGEALENLVLMAEDVLTGLKRTLPDATHGDPGAIKALSNDLDRNREKYLADESIKGRIWWLYSAFLGNAVIANAPRGKCVWVQGPHGDPCLRITPPNGEDIMAAPFTRVSKHLIDGPEYSMYAWFIAIGNAVRNGMPAS
jgi:hypothetical protein